MATKKQEGMVGRSDIYKVDPDHIIIKDGWNPRKEFGDEKDIELKNNIAEIGVKMPLIVKRNEDGKFELIDGERRLRAVWQAREEGAEIISVPCMMERKTINQADAMIIALSANEGKRLTPSEEAEAYQRLIDWGFTAEKIAKKVGKSTATIYNRLKLVDGSEEIKEAIDNKEITIKDAQTIIEESHGDIEKQEEYLESLKVKEEDTQDVVKGKSKKKKVSVNIEEIQDMIDENVQLYNSCEDPHERQYYAGLIQAFSIVLDQESPI